MKRLREVNYKSNLGMRLGLERVSAIAAELGVFQNKIKFIHVAGTNGKGSVCYKVAHALQHDIGCKVGLFTSPHISTFRERIQINQKILSLDDSEELAERITSASTKAQVEPTYFENLTMMAFLHFHLQNVDFAVVEAGLGGLTDSTNIINNPCVTAISNVALDHQEFLGDNIESIARNKSGIFKPNCPVVLGPNAHPLNVFQETANSLNCPVHLVNAVNESVNAENTAIAEKIIEIIDPNKSKSLLAIKPPCRFEQFKLNYPDENGTRLDVIFDAAHNPDAFSRLRRDLSNAFSKDTTFTFVIAMSTGKKAETCLKEIIGCDSEGNALSINSVCFTRGQNESRVLEPELLRNFVDLMDTKAKNVSVNIEKDPRVAVQKSMENMKSSHVLVICGTFFLMNEAKLALGLAQNVEIDEIDMNEQKI